MMKAQRQANARPSVRRYRLQLENLEGRLLLGDALLSTLLGTSMLASSLPELDSTSRESKMALSDELGAKQLQVFRSPGETPGEGSVRPLATKPLAVRSQAVSALDGTHGLSPGS